MASSANNDSFERITLLISRLLRIGLVVAAVLAVITANWAVLFASMGTLVLSYVPRMLASQVKIRLPLQFEFIILFFLYASIVLGEIGGYYQRFWWWDVVLHAGASFAFGFAGFLILYILHLRSKLSASPFLISVFAASFAIAIGVMWEIFEYAMDSFFGFNMQKSGLQDTMWDLIVDSLSAVAASTIGYIYLKHNVRDPFDVLIGWFLKANPRFNAKSGNRKR